MNGLNLSEASDIRLGSNTINAIYYGPTLLWPSKRDYSKEYLTIEAVSDATVLFNKNNDNISRTIQYSKDKNTWNTISFVHPSGDITESSPVSLLAGEKLYLKGNNSSYGTPDGSFCRINIHEGFGNIYGNIMSLIYGDNFYGQTVLDTSFSFMHLFYAIYHNNIIDASNLILPATTLSKSCYYHMFNGCTSLTSAPELPATTLASHCYGYMFANCEQLTVAPELPATTLASCCYPGMFSGCISLTTAPELPAKTLPQGSDSEGCYSHMFNGCISLTTAPELPATVLTGFAYWGMFSNCESLSYIKCLAIDIDAIWCTRKWLDGVSSTGTFVKNTNMQNWPTGTDGIPSGWTVQDAS